MSPPPWTSLKSFAAGLAARTSLFWIFQCGGWALFWGAMVIAGLSQWPLGFTFAYKSSLTLLGFGCSLLLRSGFRLLRSRSVPLPAMVIAALPLSYAMAAIWMAASNFVLARLLRHPALFPDFTNAIYYSFVLLAWSVLYFGVQAYIGQEAGRVRLREAELLAHEARLRALRLQLNPHFLFNALNAVSTLIAEERNADANRMLSSLADFLRMTLEAPEADEVPLETEMAFARRYLEIEKIRFGERLRVEIRVEPAAVAALVPSMILQPLIENAIRHAVASSAGGGSVGIAVSREEGWLRVRVDDDGNAEESLHAGHGIGLSNTRGRMAQLYGAAGEVRLSPRQPGGMTVSLRFPFRSAAAEAIG